MEREMTNSLEKTEKWIKFHGKVLKETPEYTDLLATDGSEGWVRLFKGSYRRTGEGVEVLIGGRARVIMKPSAGHKACVEMSHNSRECKKCKFHENCEGTCCVAYVEFCCKKPLIVNECDSPWRCP